MNVYDVVVTRQNENGENMAIVFDERVLAVNVDVAEQRALVAAAQKAESDGSDLRVYSRNFA